ncbi:MAG: NAD(P)H-dependent oxidoreductase [Aureispira sp.]
MKVQIIYCHPSKKSYTYEILEQIKATLDKAKITYDISDLYAMGFQTDMNEAEYEREGFAKIELPIPKEVKEEHEKIAQADALIFIYPVWWSDCPAKLKGWFDRVYSVGYAYGTANSTPSEKMKPIKYGLVICTAGHPNEYLKEIGIAESMRNIMIDDRLGNRFLNKELIILGGTLDKETVQPIHTKIINSIGDKIKKHCS